MMWLNLIPVLKRESVPTEVFHMFIFDCTYDNCFVRLYIYIYIYIYKSENCKLFSYYISIWNELQTQDKK